MAESPSEEVGENLLIGQEQKGFDYFVKEVKKVIFVVLFVLLKEEGGADESMLLEYIQVSLDYVQMCYFPFNPKIYYVWKATGFLQIIYYIFNMLQIQTYLPAISYTTFIVSVYSLLLLILLIILDILYVSYSFSRKRFAFMWPLQILRSVASFVVTVLYLPITETLLYAIQCQTDPDTGKLVLYYFSSVECWKGWHIFHGTLACLFTFIFTVICAIVAYAFFEPRMNSGNRKAREDTKGEVAFILNKVVCQTLFSFLGKDQVWILVIVTFILSFWLFMEYNYSEPFYDPDMSLFSQIISSFYLWTNSLLLISTALYDTSFNGGLVAWMLGFPFLVSIMIIKKKSRIETLVRSQNKFRSGEQIQAHLRYVLQLIQYQEKDKNAYMLLIGYIEKHKETCQEEDCPLKIKKSLKKKSAEKEIDEQIRYLLQELERMYISGLKKFPDSTRLRLSYAFFLLERFKNKNKAYEQLVLAERGKPAFYQQFIIYRYQKIIKENLDEENENNSDIVSLIAFDNHISLCEEYIKLSANLHKEFWAELKEDRPDLGKLNIIGASISKTVNEAKEQYQKMQKINPSVPQTIKVFGNFVKNVLNDKAKGQELLKQSKFVKEALRQGMTEKKEELNLEVAPIPFVYVSSKKSDQGIIVNLNSLFTTFFGYQKEELVGKKMTVLLPKIYTGVHEKYIKSFIENILMNLRVEAEIESDYLDVEKVNYFKHKNGYIFPLSYKVVLNLDVLMFIATFKGEATIKSFVYFIVDRNWEIQEMSTGAITYFDLEIKTVLSKPCRLDILIPEVVGQGKGDIMYSVKGVDGGEEVFYFKKEVTEIQFPKRSKAEDSDDEDNKGPENSGYKLIKLERIDRSEANIRSQSMMLMKKGKTSSGSLAPDSQSSHQNIPKITVGQGSQYRIPVASSYKIEGNSETVPLRQEVEVDQQFVAFMQDLYATPRYDDYKELFNKMQVDEQSVDRLDYGEGIILRRYIHGQIVGIDEEQEEDFLKLLEEEEQENSIFNNKGDNFEDEDDYKIFTHSNSAGLIKKALGTKHNHDSIVRFKLHSTLWITFIIVITILEYYFCVSYFEQHKKDIYVIKIVNLKLVDLNNIVSRVLDYTIAEQGLYGPKYNIAQLAVQINQISQQILELNLYVNDPTYYDFYEQFNQDINFRFFDQDLSYDDNIISFEASIMMINSYALNVSISNPDQHLLTNSYIQGVIFNFFNRVSEKLNDISASIYHNIDNRLNSPEVELLVLLAVLLVVSVFSMGNFILLMFSIKMQRENILFLFLDIQKKHLEKLYKKCEKFVKGYISMRDLMTKNEMEGYESSDDDGEQEEQVKLDADQDEEDQILKQSQNRRKIINDYRMNKFKGNKGIILQFLLIALFTLIFAVFNIISTMNERSQITFLLPQYYQSSYLTSVYGYYINIQKLMMIDYEYEIRNQSIPKVAIDNLKNFTGNTIKLRSFTYSLLTQFDNLRDLYMTLYYGDVCGILSTMPNASLYDNCDTIINSNMKMGLANVEQFYLEYFRDNLAQFELNKTKFSTLLSNKMLQEIDLSLYQYVDESVSYLTNYEDDMITTTIDNTQNIQLLLLIIFVFLLLIFFVVFWIPYLNDLNTQINQTIEMLSMIPIHVIKENKSIRRFVKNLIKSMDNYQGD